MPNNSNFIVEKGDIYECMDASILAYQYAPHWYKCTNVKYKKGGHVVESYTEFKLDKLSNDSNITFREANGNIILGPFKVASSLSEGKYTYLITTDNGNIEGDKFYSDSNAKYEIADIKGKEFYLKMSKNDILNKSIIKVRLNGEKEVTKKITDSYEITATYTTIGLEENNENPMDEFQRVKVTGTLEKEENITESEQPYVEWEMEYGNLEITKQDAHNETEKMKDVELKIENADIGYNETFKTDEEGKIFIENLYAGTYTITEISNPYYGYTVMETGNVNVKAGKANTYTLKNKKQTGNLRIEKKDADSGEFLKKVSFNIKSKDNNQYVQVKIDNEWKINCTGIVHLEDMKFVDNEKDATTFTTNDNGIIEIRNILKGTYEVKEISVGDAYFGYELDDDYISWSYSSAGDDTNTGKGEGKIATVTVKARQSINTTNPPFNSKKRETVVFNNKRKYIKISGYAWEDIIDTNKDSTSNYLYNEGEERLNNINVRLKNGDKVLASTTTHNITNKEGKEERGAYVLGDYLNNSNAQKIKIEDLEGAYIEFEYNGLAYGTIPVNSQSEEGNKATDAKVREKSYNQEFEYVKNNRTIKGYNELGEETKGKKIEYKEDNYTSILDYKSSIKGYDNQKYPITSERPDQWEYWVKITANTKDDKLSEGKLLGQRITKEEIYSQGLQEIPNINLGLYEREQPDISILKDLYNVRISINGYNHIYEYGQRLNHLANNSSDEEAAFNAGVQFPSGKQNDYNNISYSRAIYTSDYDYQTTDNSGELEIYATYKLIVNNESDNLKVRVNEIVDYYHEAFTFESIGTGIDAKGKTTGNVVYTNDDTNKKLYINTDTKIAGKSEGNNKIEIYVQFKINRDELGKFLHEATGDNQIYKSTNNLENIAEITSYSVFDKNGSIYAGIDKDSNPGNADLSKVREGKKEDDTSIAPGFMIEVRNAREITGTVFLDKSDFTENVDSTHTGETRNGDGIYDYTQEKAISGVKVGLYKVDNTSFTIGKGGITYITGNPTGKTQYIDRHGNVIEGATSTDSSGKYKITNFEPGEYVIVYTWGNQTYIGGEINKPINVDEYKGTIYKEKERATKKDWYRRTPIEDEWRRIKYSDAMDDYLLRKNIDNNSNNSIMNSMTPKMRFGIEYTDDVRDNYLIGKTNVNDQLQYMVLDVDFGLTERARQEIDIKKRVKSVEITLANGQSIAGFKVKEDGSIEKSKGIAYMEPSPTGVQTNGMVKAEMDSELIQGSTVKIQYVISLENNSEKDYDSEEYYLYGINGTEDQIIRYVPSGIYDYLDSELVLTENEESRWETKTIADYNSSVNEPTITEDYLYKYNSASTDSEGNVLKYTGYEAFKEQYKVEDWNMETITEARIKRLANKTILYNGDIENIAKDVMPGDSKILAELTASKVLSNANEISLNNDVEITEVTRQSQTGRKVTPSSVYDRGESVVITTPTGENKDYIPIITTAITLLITLGAGIVFIKKKILT